MTRGDLHWYLGVEINRIGHQHISVSQGQYVRDMLEVHGVSDVKPASMPCDAGIVYVKRQQEEEMFDIEKYRKLIGSLLYLSVTSRPDICFIVNSLSRFVTDPSEIHWNAAKRLLRYLKRSIDFALHDHYDAELGDGILYSYTVIQIGVVA
eukprot:GHVQ01039472.1.p1 GENE.GHVQ01039472.1~~GHVQ01039472.1.p1  ORF type:complete len:151 (-),score=9.13 GHVQ01039472.1:172-624(-)